MSLGSVGGTITSVVGLGITLGALGLALEFTDRAFDRASPRKRSGKRKPIFDTGRGSGQNMNSMFDPIPRRTSSKRKNDPFAGDFF